MNEYTPIEEPRSPAEMSSLSKDDMHRLIAQRNEVSARATLVESLVIMGQLDEAMSISNDSDKKEWIRRLKVAEEKDDDHRCNCEAKIDVTDYALAERQQIKPDVVLAKTPHYIRTYRLFSSKHNQMAWFYKCSECGCVQTIPDDIPIDDFHAKHYDKRREALEAELKKGTPIRNPQLPRRSR